jgi:hypothetical protein
METKHWQDRITVLLGVWILISPVVLGFAPGQTAVMWNSWFIGVVMLIVSAGRAVAEVPKLWQEAATLVLGLWLVISPWMLGFAAHAPARNTTIVAGLLVVGITLWTIILDIDVRKWMDIHLHHLPR